MVDVIFCGRKFITQRRNDFKDGKKNYANWLLNVLALNNNFSWRGKYFDINVITIGDGQLSQRGTKSNPQGETMSTPQCVTMTSRFVVYCLSTV
jgi:hypothetical protein